MTRLILGTAGHIDHGKSTLVRALTGIDTDRLAEEKRRGITIDLGFARLVLQDGTEFGIVDVPGHEAFVRNMLAGASGIDLVLLVVAADEGVMPQTREHLAIVELLGVRAGVVAVTKADLVDDDWLELVVDDIRSALQTSPFANAPIIPVSSVTGTGLNALRAALSDVAQTVTDRRTDDLARLPIDRVFTVRGTGTVVTGTLWSGRIPREATARLLPAGGEARIRGVQVHGDPVEAAEAGQRAAIALAGVDRADVRRGDVLVLDPAWTASRMVTARIRVVADSVWEITPRQRVRFHLGTAEVLGRVALLDCPRLEPGEAGWAQIRLEAPVVARAGDRFVLRSYSPITTIGGGIVVEPDPPKRKRLDAGGEARLEAVAFGSPQEAVRARVAAQGWRGQPILTLPIETPHSPDTLEAAIASLESLGHVVRVGDRLFDHVIMAEARRRFVEAVEAHHARHPLRPGIAHEELRRSLPDTAPPTLVEWNLERLLQDRTFEARHTAIARAGFRPTLDAEQERLRGRFLAMLAEGGLAPPALGEWPPEWVQRPDFRDILRLLEEEGAIVALGSDLYLSATAVASATRAIRERLRGKEGLGPADFKAVLPVTRKYLIPLLEHFDRIGVTARRGDGRTVTAG